METGDVLVVTKLDRLGRNAMDVRATVERLANAGVRVHCLALGGVDLTSPAGRMTMQVIAAVAEFEQQFPDTNTTLKNSDLPDAPECST
jgi:putative DNA-invertase from lambdoid prophage Rac